MVSIKVLSIFLIRVICELTSSRDRSDESAFVLREALRSLVMCSGGEALGIVRDVAAIALISFETGKTEERDGNIVRPRFTNSGEAEGCRGRFFVRNVIAMMRAAVFLDQPHPHSRVMRKVLQLVRINRVAY